MTSPEDTKKNGCEEIVQKHWYHFCLPAHRNGRAISLFVWVEVSTCLFICRPAQAGVDGFRRRGTDTRQTHTLRGKSSFKCKWTCTCRHLCQRMSVRGPQDNRCVCLTTCEWGCEWPESPVCIKRALAARDSGSILMASAACHSAFRRGPPPARASPR